MNEFAINTGLTNGVNNQARYLWTDAFCSV